MNPEAKTDRTGGWWLIVPVLAVIGLAGGLGLGAQTFLQAPPVTLSTAVPQSSSAVNRAPQAPKSKIGIDFIALPAGSFIMGSAMGGREDERPSRTVRVMPFFMSRFEVTQKQWTAVMGDNPSRFRDPRRPVDQVTWEQAMEFVSRLNRLERTNRYRLPSEAEWEYAARAGSTSAWFFGDDGRQMSEFGWVDGREGTHAVGRKSANPWGLYDMYGNVWEWVFECYHPTYTDAPPDARPWAGGNCQRRVMRGGGWDSDAMSARSAARGSYPQGMGDAATGFRIVWAP